MSDDRERLRAAYERYRQMAEHGESLTPTPDTPGQARIKEHLDRKLRDEQGEEWMKQNANCLRAEWGYMKWMFFDLEENQEYYLQSFGLD